MMKTAFSIFFACRDDAAIKMGENTDGNITLKSQLDGNAMQVYGYDENRMSILANKEALEQYNEILAGFAEK